MDTANYTPIFLTECRDYLQALNLAIVALETEPANQAAQQEIFRVCHSLKGMSAMMGFGGMSSIAHGLEDALQSMQSGASLADRDHVDALFSAVDALESMLQGIEATGGEPAEVAQEQVERLTSLFPAAERPGGRRGRGSALAAGGAAVSARPPRNLPGRAGDPTVVHVQVNLDDDVQMPGARAFMVKRAVAELGEVVAADPDDVEGFDGREVQVWIASQQPAEQIRERLIGMPEVADVSLSGPPAPQHDGATGNAPSTAPSPAVGVPAGSSAKPPPPRAGYTPSRLENSVRVDTARLDELMFTMQEVLGARSRLETEIDRLGIPELRDRLDELARHSQQLQALVMQVRMTPVETAFARLPRLVRDLAGRFDKDVDLVVTGGHTEVDRSVIDVLADPLVHLVRNALDHGIESPDERAAAGKPRRAVLEIGARQSSGQVIITVHDDGRGIDPTRVVERALERGLLDPVAAERAREDEQEAFGLIFLPGLSTAKESTDISGRGVGLDSVRATALELGGDVTVSSEQGNGSSFSIRLPLTLAILTVLLVEIEDNIVAIPIDRVARIERFRQEHVREVGEERLLVLAEGSVPLMDLGARLGFAAMSEPRFAVLVHGGDDQLVGVQVGELRGQRDLVTRPLPEAVVRDSSALLGAGVLPDGDIALIVDCEALAEQAP